MLEGDGVHATNARKALAEEQDLLASLRRHAATLATADLPPVVDSAAADENGDEHSNNQENEESEVENSNIPNVSSSSSSTLLPRSPLGRSNSGNEIAEPSGFLSPATKAAAQEIIANAGLSGSSGSGSGKHHPQAPRSSRGRLAARLQATARSPGGDKQVMEANLLPEPPPEDRGSENAAPPVAL